jgi:hypothetical protein
MRHLPSTLGSKKGAAFSFSLLGGKFSAFYSNICRFGLDPNPAPYSEHQKNEQKDRPLGISIHPKLTLFGVTVLVLTLLQDLLELGPEP